MRWKWHSPEEISGKLADVYRAQRAGLSRTAAVAAAGISEATYTRWRARYANLDPAQVARMRELESENARLRRALAELDESVTA
jgi:hypothetical protein